MVRYIKCPRCELNYIDAEKQEYCDICLKEMRGIQDLDLDLDDPEEEIATELCPICGENMMRAGEKMCDVCRKKAEYEEEDPDPEADDDEWREYLDDDTDADLDREMGELGELDEAFDDAEEEEDETYEGADSEEDLEYVTGDEIYTLGDDDDDDDDGDGDDRDDKDDDF